MWWFSPHLFLFVFVYVMVLNSCRGEYTGWSIIYNSRSPLYEPDLVGGLQFNSDVGEIHRVEIDLYSRSPLYEPE